MLVGIPLAALVVDAGSAAAANEPYSTWGVAQVDKYAPFAATYPFEPPASPAPPAFLPLVNSVSCPTTSLCLGVDSLGNVIYSQNANGTGATWAHLDIDGDTQLVAVSCASSTMCAAVDSAGRIFVSTQPTSSSAWVNVSGNDYTGVLAGTTFYSLTSISCAGAPPTYTCAAVGNSLGNGYLFVSTNPLSTTGTTSTTGWPTTPNYQDSLGNLMAASCPTIQFCIAGDAQGNVVYNGGPGSGAAIVSGGNSGATNSWPTVGNVSELFNSNGLPGTIAGGGAQQITSVSCTVDTATSPFGGFCALGEAATATLKGTTAFASIVAPGNDITTPNPGTLAWTSLATRDTSNTPNALASVESVSCSYSSSLAKILCEAGDNNSFFLDYSSGIPPAGNFAVEATAQGSGNVITGISCPAVNDCVAVGNLGFGLVSAQGFSGVPPGPPGNWSLFTATVDGVSTGNEIDGVDSITSMACPASTLCVAGDAVGRIITSATPSSGTASAWTLTTKQVDTNFGNTLTGIGCASTVFCTAVDSSGHVFTSTSPAGGQSAWSTTADIDGSNTLNAISCPSTGLCVAGDNNGNLVYSSNPNASSAGSWTVLNVDGSNQIKTVSCPSTSLCIAGDNHGNIIVNANGSPTAGLASWAVDNVDGAATVTSVACPSASECVGVDASGNALYSPSALYSGSSPVKDKASWTTVAAVGRTFAAVSCPTTNICLAVGTDASTNARAYVTPQPSTPSQAPGQSWCEIGVSTCGTAPFIGVDPSPIPNTTSPFTVTALACSSPGVCEAGDNAGNILTGSSGGLAITTTSLPAGVLNLPYNHGTPFCISATGGVPPYTWQLSPAPPPGLTYQQSGTCLNISGTPTSVGTYSFTVNATDSSSPPQHASSVTLSITILASWSAPTLVDYGSTPGLIVAPLPSLQVSCVSNSFCMEGDSAGRALDFNGSSWSAPMQADGTFSIASTSCTSTTFCALVDSCGNAVIGSGSNNGLTWAWGVPTPLTGSGSCNSPLNAVSCVVASPVVCVAVSNAGAAYEYNGVNWLAAPWAPTIDAGVALTSVSCVASNSCMAVDANGNYLLYAGGNSWSAPATANLAGAGKSYVSCYNPAAFFCAAVRGHVANWYFTAGTHFVAGTVQTLDAGAAALQSVSCTLPPSGGDTEFCITVDSIGSAYGYNGTQWDNCPVISGGAPCVVPPPGWNDPINGISLNLVSVSCTSTTALICIAGSASGSVLSFSGASDAWSPLITPSPVDVVDSLVSMACPSSTLCAAGTANGQVMAAAITSSSPPISSASAWQQVSNLNLSSSVSGMSCPSVSLCVGVAGGNVVYSTTPATFGSWQAITNVDHSGSNLSAVSCPTTTLCVGVDSAGYVVSSTNPTASWAQTTTQLLPVAGNPSLPLTGISCVGTSASATCVASGNFGQIAWSTNPTSTSASAWTVTNAEPLAFGLTAGQNNFNAVSCPSTSLCVAVDVEGNVLTSTTPTGAGSSWVVASIDPTVSPKGYSLTSVACPTTTFCVAGDANGDILGSLNPTGGSAQWWNAPMDASNPNAQPTVGSIACAGILQCASGDSGGRILTSSMQTSVSITSLTLANATVGTSYSSTLTAAGGSGTYTWTAVNALPPNLTLSTAGLLSGKVASAGTYSFQVSVSDTSTPPQSATALLTLSATVSTLTISTSTLPATTVGATYSQTLSATGGTPPYTWTMGLGSTLPTGLTLAPSTGVISGVPASAGTSSFTVQVADSATPQNTATVTLSIAVTSSQALAVTTTSVPQGTVGTAYSTTLTASGGTSPYSWSLASGSTLPAGITLSSSGTVSGTPTKAGTTNFTVTVNDTSSPVQVASATLQLVVVCTTNCNTPPPSLPNGYWEVGGDGAVYNFGQVSSFGSASGITGGAAGMVATPDAKGYWVVSRTGQVKSFGDASSSIGNAPASQGVVGIAATTDGGGYWVATSAGAVAAVGDAVNHGSMAGTPLVQPVVGIAATPDGAGYWMVASDGGIFTFGDAGFFGSMGGIRLNKPVVGIAATSDGRGYWMVASDGGIFTFGDAGFMGSMGGKPLLQPVVGMVATPDGKGYWMAASDGGVFTFGDASFSGSLGGKTLTAPIVGMAGP